MIRRPGPAARVPGPAGAARGPWSKLLRMDEPQIQVERSQNLWDRSVRKMPPLERASAFVAAPDVHSDQIGGLAQAQDELLSYACTMTNPEVYAQWGTFPPTGLLLMRPFGLLPYRSGSVSSWTASS